MKKNSIYIVIGMTIFGLGLLAGRMFFNFTAPTIEGHDHVEDTKEEETIWTCSMHPSIKQPEPGLCPICGMDLIPLEANTSQDPTALTMTNEAIRLAHIQTQPVGQDGKNETSNASWLINGKILPDERQVYAQVPHLTGRIESLEVTYEGMYVKKGDKIADIYAPEMIAAQREFLEAQKLIDINPDLLESARDKLRFLKIPPTFIENLENTGEVVETFPLLAGKSGYVLNKQVEVGDYISSGQVVFDIYNLGSLWAVFDVYEKDISKVKKGDVIEFSALAVPNQKFKTRIDFINPLLDQDTRAIRVRGQVANRGGVLKPQMLIRGNLLSGSDAKAGPMMIPKTAVLWTGRESVVYVQDTTMDIPTFTFREVTLGSEIGSQYQVLDGLAPGEEIVTNGVFAVDASAQLNNQRSMMNRMVDAPHGDEHPEKIEPVDPEEVTEEARGDLELVLQDYINLKNNLVTGEPDPVQQSLEDLSAVLDQLNEREDMGTHNAAWNAHLKNFKHHLNRMNKETDVAGWRDEFVSLSTVLIRWVMEFGNPGTEKVYVQHCPMANSDQGADWLSMDEDIRNPYYGSQMLTCGITEDTLMQP